MSLTNFIVGGIIGYVYVRFGMSAMFDYQYKQLLMNALPMER
jgi:hypothetical protein